MHSNPIIGSPRVLSVVSNAEYGASNVIDVTFKVTLMPPQMVADDSGVRYFMSRGVPAAERSMNWESGVGSKRPNGLVTVVALACTTMPLVAGSSVVVVAVVNVDLNDVVLVKSVVVDDIVVDVDGTVVADVVSVGSAVTGD